MNAIRPRRLINMRLTILVGLMFVVGVSVFGVLSAAQPSYYYIHVASRYLTPGMPLTANDLELVEAQGNGPGRLSFWGDGAGFIDTYITPEQMTEILAQTPIMVNTRYPGDEVRLSDLYVPSAVACASGVGSAAAPVPSLDPATPPRFAHRLTDLLCGNQRAIVITGDATSTFARAGDLVDLYIVLTNDDSTVVKRLMTKRVIYVIDRLIPSDPYELDGYVPTGTTLILDFSAQDAQDLIYASTIGSLRIGLASPLSDDGTTVTEQSDAQRFVNTYGFQIPGLDILPEVLPETSPTPSPTPSPAPNSSPSPSPSPTPKPSPTPTPPAP